MTSKRQPPNTPEVGDLVRLRGRKMATGELVYLCGPENRWAFVLWHGPQSKSPTDPAPADAGAMIVYLFEIEKYGETEWKHYGDVAEWLMAVLC